MKSMPSQKTGKTNHLIIALAMSLVSIALAVFWFILTHFANVPPLGPIAH